MLVDWQQVILDLRRAHYPLERASVECGMCKSWLGKFAGGNYSEPSFTPAVRLLQLHRRVCGDDANNRVLRKVQIKQLRLSNGDIIEYDAAPLEKITAKEVFCV